MWRCLFMAVGIFAIILGLETMFLDQVLMTNKRRLSKIIAAKTRSLSERNDAQNPYQLPSYRGDDSYANENALSRFWDRTRDTFRQPGYGNAAYDSAGKIEVPTYRAPVPAKSTGLRVVKMKDWMPWSLLAAGSIIVLYSHSRGSTAE